MGDIFNEIKVLWNSEGKQKESSTERVKRA